MHELATSAVLETAQSQSHTGPDGDAHAYRTACTWLVTPGATPDRFEASVSSGADVALLDLEDSVPALGKDSARASVLDFLSQGRTTGDSGPTVLGVRINGLGTVHGLMDLVKLAESGHWPSVLVVPKVEAARDVELVARIVGASSPCQIWALIETPRAIQNLRSILLSRALAGVLFGAADYAAAVGCKLTSTALWYPKAALAAGAAAAGLPAVDSPYFGLRDLDGLRQETEKAVDLGFIGKAAIHPQHLPVIQEAFRPDPRDLAAARAVVSAADAAGGGITTVDGQMVGPPLVAAARTLTTRAGDEPTLTDRGESHRD